MANRPGLPTGFSLKIPKPDDSPVQVGDYLEQIEEASQPRVIDLPKQPPPNTSIPRPTTKRVGEVRGPQITAPRGNTRPSIPRREFNLSVASVRMLDDLLAQLREQGPQKDARGSEVFEALLTALHEARQLINYGSLKPRGAWGQPTAKAFITELKNNYQRAIHLSIQTRARIPTQPEDEVA